MAKPDAKKWPELKRAWDEYGHVVPWEHLFDMKTGGHPYVALAWLQDAGGRVTTKKEEAVEVHFADLAAVAWDGPWEMQNDDGEGLTMRQWRAAKVVPECDWMEWPREEETA